MSGISKLIKTTGNMFVSGYPLFSLLFLVWTLGTGEMIYWDGYNMLIGLVAFLVVLAFLPFLIFLFLSDLRTGWRILASLLAFPLLCISFFFWLDLPFYSQVNETRFADHKYLLAHHNSLYVDDAYDWYLFECTSTGIFCTPTLLYSDEYGEFYNDSSASELIVDRRAHELHVVVAGDLLYTVGRPSRTYIPMLRTAQRGEYRYNLSQVVDPDTGFVMYGLYECNGQYACQRIPFAYSLSRAGAARIHRISIEIDAETHEVRILRQFENQGAELIFSYGDQPRCYVKECSISDE